MKDIIAKFTNMNETEVERGTDNTINIPKANVDRLITELEDSAEAKCFNCNNLIGSKCELHNVMLQSRQGCCFQYEPDEPTVSVLKLMKQMEEEKYDIS